MSYYYPWLSDNWNDAMNPPWGKWKMYIEELNKAFFNPDGTAKIHANLKFHPVLDASQKMRILDPTKPPTGTNKVPSGLSVPGHADMHKQIRVVWNLLKRYPSVTGMWFLGWNSETDDSDGIAHVNWTENRKWAEAIQNEPHATEGILEAIPDSNRLNYNFFERGISGTYIPYSLSERASFSIRIYDGDIDDKNLNAKLVRTLDEGYDGVSPQGEFRNSPYNRLGNRELRGTSAFWDYTNDAGVPVVDSRDYYAYLFIGETKVHGPDTITVPKAKNRKES